MGSAKEFFTKGAVSYVEFKAQCQSLRMFAFIGVNLFCVGSLMVDPPKSSYWMRYSPSFLYSNIKGMFLSSSPPLFLTEKVEHQADTKTIVTELITMRRLASAGTDSEEE